MPIYCHAESRSFPDRDFTRTARGAVHNVQPLHYTNGYPVSPGPSKPGALLFVHALDLTVLPQRDGSLSLRGANGELRISGTNVRLSSVSDGVISAETEDLEAPATVSVQSTGEGVFGRTAAGAAPVVEEAGSERPVVAVSHAGGWRAAVQDGGLSLSSDGSDLRV